MDFGREKDSKEFKSDQVVKIIKIILCTFSLHTFNLT